MMQRNHDWQIEKIISLMTENHISPYCLQETWQLCNYILTIRGHSVFHHGMREKPQRQGRTSAGVMIILNPALTQAWAQAGKLKLITPLPTSKSPGRMIGLTLSFTNKLNRPPNPLCSLVVFVSRAVRLVGKA